MNATPADQRRLLDLVELDDRIRNADRLRTKPPQASRVQELVAQRQTLSQELSGRLGVRDDLRSELARLESDVSLVESRQARDTERLKTVTNPKDAQGLEHELTSLARRKRELEDAELELMERLETADAAVSEQESLIAAVNEEGAALSAQGKEVVATATAEFEAATRDRAAVASSIDGDLVALFDRLAPRNGGAGLLRRGTCEACRMVLSGTDLQTVRHAEPDAVVFCPECGAILVRTEESGL